MNTRNSASVIRRIVSVSQQSIIAGPRPLPSLRIPFCRFGHPKCIASSRAPFHTTLWRRASSPTVEAHMENLNDLYATAKDEFEIAAEETEKKTVYASNDREAAKEAFMTLKEAFQQAVKHSDPEVGKDIQGRVGPRIWELQNALTALEESAMED